MWTVTVMWLKQWWKRHSINQSSSLWLCFIILSPLLLIVNPPPKHSGYKRPWKRKFMKTIREKQKMLVTSIFCFSHTGFFSDIVGWLYSGFRLFASRICQRKYCNKAVGPITRKLHPDWKSDWTADADDSFVLLTDVHHWNLNHLFLFLCKMNRCLILFLPIKYIFLKAWKQSLLLAMIIQRLAWTLNTNSMKICFDAYHQLPVVQQLLPVYFYL